MNVPVYTFTCENGHSFEAPHLVGDYGQFLLRSVETSQPAVLNALEDPVYLEVDALLEELGAYKGHSALDRAEILQGVFGAACDLSPDRSEYRIGEPPRCPLCCTKRMSSWARSEPRRVSSAEIDHVTHRTWDRRTHGEKRQILSGSLVANREASGD